MSTVPTTSIPSEIQYPRNCSTQSPSLDPLLVDADPRAPTSHPSSVPPGYWPEPIARRTLTDLCLVNHAWYEAAKPWLWHKLEVRLPRTWLSLVEEIAWNYDEETIDSVMGRTIQEATRAAMNSASILSNKSGCFNLDENLLGTLDIPETSITPDLLSPIPSRDPSPRRLRPKSQSPARWKIFRTINDAIQDVMNTRAPGVYGIPDSTRSASRTFRPTSGLQSLPDDWHAAFRRRRSQQSLCHRGQSSSRAQVFGATEYMDGALTLPVLNELFLRGAPSGGRGRPTRGRALMELHDIEEEDRERRRECKDLEAVDFTGCVSAVFVNAFTDFVNAHLLPPAESDSSGDEDESGRHVRQLLLNEPLLFSGLKRLGMRGVKSILPRYLGPFVLAFPNLTHLDLSGTRLTPDILDALGESSTMRLRSLALARCIKLTSECITRFLVESPVTEELTELNLYGDMTYVSPITPEDLLKIITLAPCLVKGNLVYLDLSSAPINQDVLSYFKPQPKLRSLGLSHILHLKLKAITEFIKQKAPNVEILTLVNTSPELDCGIRIPATISLHTQLIRPLCSPPFTTSLSQPSSPPQPPPSRLRVVELSTGVLGALGAGAGSWRIIRSKGGRGWYVDTASAWVAEPNSGECSALRRDLPPTHPFREAMESYLLPTILHGHGMLGREDGLYGAVSFAYQG
ncbi:hypothetical protein CPB84DRAFT_1779790 [Gymnopilus junonius]|uniref:Uncharacterized protein n=1 Tax=Gymnopilus junonius TaxID=109634 RepID=A0A9P5NP74_GYMJU|nr:hypothetical protein CPB84DRAFT_1779790 [Gymnopilus junonius]